jgi:hypothetical protein
MEDSMDQANQSRDHETKDRVQSLSVSKQLMFSVIIITGIFMCLELTVRVGAYFLYGQSPYFLLYGISSAMADDKSDGHSAARKGYFKFQSGRVLHQYGMFEKPTPIQINSLGFRGERVSPAKALRYFSSYLYGGVLYLRIL